MANFQVLVFVLCVLTSAICAALLFRHYAKVRTRLLLWSAFCFALLTANNLFVLADIVLFPDINLTPFRQFSSLAAVTVLLCGFIWETN
jgi:hypothetical protein